MARKPKKGKGDDDEDGDEKDVTVETVQGSGLSRKQQRMQKLQAKELNKRTTNEPDDDQNRKGLEESDEDVHIPEPVSKKGKIKPKQQSKGRFDVDDQSEEEEELPQPASKKGWNIKENVKGKDFSVVDNESENEEEEEVNLPKPVSKKGKKKMNKKVLPDKWRLSASDEEDEKKESISKQKVLQQDEEDNVEASDSKIVQPEKEKTSNVQAIEELQKDVENMDIIDKDVSDEEKARKKAEKEARRLRKAEKEAAKREKNLELIRASQADTSQDQERPSADQDNVDGIMYGAPDDVVWTDKSAAMLEAEKLGKSGPDLSLVYGADGKKLSNKERKKIQKEREAAERAEEVEKAAAKLSAEGAQFACSQTAFNENDPQWQNSLDINIPSFNISAAGKILFKDSPFYLSHGRRCGLVGPNGRGKSTLLKMINSRDLRLPPRIDYLYVEQEVVADDTPAVEAVLKADKIRWNLLEEEKILNAALDNGDEDPKKLARLQNVYDELSAIGADSAEAKARRILYGLGFDLEMQTKPTKMFSGGWRMRISLARALFMEPTFLMLDEPTNHLDLNAVIWLDDYLQRWKKTLLIVSHDQDFLNSVCEEIIHIEDLKLVTYKGDYDTFKKAQAIKLKDQIKSWEKQEKRLRELKRSGQSKAKATESVLKSNKREPGARSQKKTNDDIASGISTATTDELLKRPKEYAVKLEFSEVPELARPVLEVSKVHFRYSPKYPIIFDTIEFGIDMDSRVTVVGPNGAGKSTLLKLLTGEVEPTTGEVRRNPRLRMGIYNQHFVDRLPMNKSPVEHLRDRFQDEDYQSIRNRLGKYGLEGHAHEVVMRDLSGGQKARVVFVELSLQRPHILLLDEPTNNLDIETIDALIDAINEFNGGVVVVTHDQRLIEKCDCDLWVVDKQRVTKWEAGFEDYKESLLKEMEDAIEKESAARKEKLEQLAAERVEKLARIAEKLKSKQK